MDRKFKLGLLILFACLSLTGCGCSKEQYSVKFDSNGGSLVSSQTIDKNESVVEPTTAPTRDGYKFLGWFLSLDDEKPYDFSSSIVKDITLIAKWEKVEDGSTTTCDKKCETGYTLNKKTCTCEKNDQTASVDNSDVKGIKLNMTKVSLTVGQKATVKATLNPTSSKATVTWKSANEKVATVKDGVITAVGLGTAKITATAGEKTATITVSVVNQDQVNMDAAKAQITAKTLTNGNTNINDYSSKDCNIALASSTTNDKYNTIIENGIITKLYRSNYSTDIKATYNITCGGLTDSKTIAHKVSPSNYKYTATYTGTLYILNVDGASNYTLSAYDGSVTNLKYNAQANGVQTAIHKDGNIYKMVLNGDNNTIYEVRAR